MEKTETFLTRRTAEKYISVSLPWGVRILLFEKIEWSAEVDNVLSR
jgi:hypothetical protein